MKRLFNPPPTSCWLHTSPPMFDRCSLSPNTASFHSICARGWERVTPRWHEAGQWTHPCRVAGLRPLITRYGAVLYWAGGYGLVRSSWWLFIGQHTQLDTPYVKRSLVCLMRKSSQQCRVKFTELNSTVIVNILLFITINTYTLNIRGYYFADFASLGLCVRRENVWMWVRKKKTLH